MYADFLKARPARRRYKARGARQQDLRVVKDVSSIISNPFSRAASQVLTKAWECAQNAQEDGYRSRL